MPPYSKMNRTPNSDLLFVYGTLMSAYDGDYARRLRAHAALLGEASCRGELYLVSWYPGFVPDPNGPKVWGELFHLNGGGEEILTQLDAYEGITNPATLEGEEYRRMLVAVECEGVTLEAWTYIYTGIVGQLIPEGRFSDRSNGARE